MCGRTACACRPSDIIRACTYQNRKARRERPTWLKMNGRRNYQPSYNLAPGATTPVLISSKQLDNSEVKGHIAKIWTEAEVDAESSAERELEEESKPVEKKSDEEEVVTCVPFSERVTERCIMPMEWGLIPVWVKDDDVKSHRYKTSNCRGETLREKRTFKIPLEKGQRCVILADGFYEWKRAQGKGAKNSPHYIYLTNDCAEKSTTETEREPVDGDKEPEEWKGKPLLKLAGVFERSKRKDGTTRYSYSVITVESQGNLKSIHHRMPLILSDTDVKDWLDYDMPIDKVTAMVQPVVHDKYLKFHQTSSFVNSSKNNSPDCIKPVTEKAAKTSKSQQLMMNWLKSGPAAKEDSNDASGDGSDEEAPPELDITDQSDTDKEVDDDEPPVKKQKKVDKNVK